MFIQKRDEARSPGGRLAKRQPLTRTQFSIMEMLLSDVEMRILGCLLEKEMATPEYYPLSLNALTNACNQKSNRDPVVEYDDRLVVDALDGLREKQLVRQSNVGRVTKYEQIFTQGLNLITREAAAVCILLLRGPQTIGEIRGRTERLYPFQNLEEAQQTVANLEEIGLVCQLPRQPGRKEPRYAHRLGGTPFETVAVTAAPAGAAADQEADRLTALQEQIDQLTTELRQLQEEFAVFKRQFE